MKLSHKLILFFLGILALKILTCRFASSIGQEFRDKEIAGPIVSVRNSKYTEVKVGKDSTRVILGVLIKGVDEEDTGQRGIDVNDSFYKAKGDDNYHIYKKDSTGNFREIRFTPPDPDNHYYSKWKFIP